MSVLQHLGQRLEPAPLAHQVPLRHHGGHPEAVVELVVHTLGHTVAHHLLADGGVPGPHLQGVGLVVLDGPGRGHLLPVLAESLGAPELLFWSDEARVENMREA